MGRETLRRLKIVRHRNGSEGVGDEEANPGTITYIYTVRDLANLWKKYIFFSL